MPEAPFTPPVDEAEDPEYAANLRRATLASTVGSALEYYDFALYGLASALIFSKLFFTNLDPAIALVASFATFGVGFVARPLGGLFFGTKGDKLGRKWVLVVTILLMGGSSTLVGLLPTYDTIGIWAPILLVFLRLCQGFGAGAEQAGSTVLMAEYAPIKRRGFFSALPFIGIQAGTLLAAMVFVYLGTIPEELLLGWVWRIPFLASILLVLVALVHPDETAGEPDVHRLGEARADLRAPVARDLRTLAAQRAPRLRAADGRERRLVPVQLPRRRVRHGHRHGRPVDRSDRGCGGLTDRDGLGAVDRPHLRQARAAPGLPLRRSRDGAARLPRLVPDLAGSGLAGHRGDRVGIGFGVNTMLGPQCAMLPEMFGNKHRYLGVAVPGSSAR